jgi:hypothetical protein
LTTSIARAAGRAAVTGIAEGRLGEGCPYPCGSFLTWVKVGFDRF